MNGNSHPWKASDRPQGPTRERSSYNTDHDNSRLNGNYHADNGDYVRTRSRTGTATSRRTTADSRHGANSNDVDDDSKWIHRDKLAQIESQELQAAGFILPKPRSHSRVRKDNRHNDQSGAHHKAGEGSTSESHAPTSRSRTNSNQSAAADPETPSWDLRLPDEIAEEEGMGFCVASGLSKGGTRIPVAKSSPAPIPVDYLERPTPVSRKNTNDGISEEADTINYPKPRARSGSVKQADGSSRSLAAKRSATDVSPRKASSGSRKPSSRATSGSQRPKTRSGNKDSTSSNGTRPSTRSGELASSKQPEGDPPWMLSSYRPDPRLPPDQQLLPTVARRLQQEKWEKEGKFGNVLDKEFRPLNEEGFPQPPEKEEEPEPKPGSPDIAHANNEWPLREETPRSHTPKPAGSYSTMPRVQDKAPPASPGPGSMRPPTHQRTMSSVRGPERQETEKPSDKGGCGCCVVM